MVGFLWPEWVVEDACAACCTNNLSRKQKVELFLTTTNTISLIGPFIRFIMEIILLLPQIQCYYEPLGHPFLMPNPLKTVRLPSCPILEEAALFPETVPLYLKVFDLEKMTFALLLPNFRTTTFSFLSDVYQSTEKGTKVNHCLSCQSST